MDKEKYKQFFKGFTMVELIAVIVVMSVIAIMSFVSLSKTIKNSEVKEVEAYESKLMEAAQLYIETNLNAFPQLTNDDGRVAVSAELLSSKGFFDKKIKNPTECVIGETFVIAEKQKDNTLKYKVACKDKLPEIPVVEDDPTNPDNPGNPGSGNGGTDQPVGGGDSGTGSGGSGGSTLTPPIGNVVYFNPVTGQKCAANQAVSTTGTKTGCMKWYIIRDSVYTYDLILDHNTTAKVAWNSSGNNKIGPNEVLVQLKNDTSSWAGVPTRDDLYTLDNTDGGQSNMSNMQNFDTTPQKLNSRMIDSGWDIEKNFIKYTINYTGYKARLLKLSDITNRIGLPIIKEKDQKLAFYLDTKNSIKTATSKGASLYSWLFDYTASCHSSGCNIEDSNVNGYWFATASTPGSSISGAQIVNSYNTAWGIDNQGKVDHATVSSTTSYGIRPIITVQKTAVQ